MPSESRLASRTTEGEGNEGRGLVVPTYVELGSGRYLAQFPPTHIEEDAPVSVEVKRERARSYPGLAASAPRTDALYRAFAPLCRGRNVLDVGSGAGTGLSWLREAASRVGVDSSEVAVAFARRAVPSVSFELLDVAESELPRAEVAVVVDLLGEVKDPLTVLRRAVRAVGPDGIVCIAEAVASVAQELLPPVRRAFSLPEFEALLAEAGLVVDARVSERGFWAVVTRPAVSEWSQGLEAAERLVEEGLPDVALGILSEPPPSTERALGAWYLRRAELYRGERDGDAALRSLLEAQQLVPGDSRVLTALAEVMLELGAPEDARRFAVAAVERDRLSGRAVHALVRALEGHVEANEALALWALAVRLCPDEIASAVALAGAAANQGTYALGITALERIREFEAAVSVDFHMMLGWLYVMSGRSEDALIEAKIAALKSPGNAEVDALLASACEAQSAPRGLS